MSIERIFYSTMEATPFKRNGKGWYAGNSDILCGLSLCQHKYMDPKGNREYFIEFGIFIWELDFEQIYKDKRPNIYNFHIRMRLGDVRGEPYIDRINEFYEGYKISHQVREIAIKNIIQDEILPALVKLSTKVNLINSYKENIFPNRIFIGARGRILEYIDRYRLR